MKLNIEELKKLAKGQHSTGNIHDILPFRANDKGIKVNGDFKNILGEFSRLIKSSALENETAPLLSKEDTGEYFTEEVTIGEKISKQVTVDDESSRDDLRRLIEIILSDRKENNIIRPIHPHVFLYYPLSDNKNQKDYEKKVAQFAKDILGYNNDKLSKVFDKSEEDDLLIKLILDHLENLKNSSKGNKYQALNSNVITMFQQDFIFISRHREFFLDHVELLFQYYLFFYVSQLALNFHRFDKGDHNTIFPLYYGLDWETLSKRRPSISDSLSYKNLRDIYKSTFVHIHCQSQLSHLLKNEIDVKEKRFQTYKDLMELLDEEEERREFLQSLNEWLQKYCEIRGDVTYEGPVETIQQAIEKLFHYMRTSMSTSVCENYGKSLENIMHGQFLKFRGSLGYSLNITQEFLILVTALATQGKTKITLKEYFKELENRGVQFDQYSKEKIIDLLDSINIIEKKSDSGDAQYVKSIL
ncbi:DNA phosphorothioation-dependent restriction protein DptG [Salisediminibacterium beveridgei]|uniref:DNA phosphorothioation-dependent restriction protein DptG n=1 Tax=Salisediminibacterium beveridgei TaxID=632773 RepID=A0A1D7QWZ8_9BACI|nr:DNA phosphorothioation-dependent restriction protein DptG [Salisediminibacterium beveridgei]AOM83531.1 hypothetical protein BBEV_2173 [Salisediminibacterium beveridgei]